MLDSYYKHPQSIVENGATIGDKSRIWAWSHILSGAVIGSNCNVCDHTFIENDVFIGSNVTIKCGVYIWDGIRIEDDVFIGPNVTFTNDIFPRSKKHPDEYNKTLVKKGASIGANATILPVIIGDNAMIGAGAVVTNDVPANAIVKGNPARITGYCETKKVNSSNLSNGKDLASNIKDVRIINIPSFDDLRGNLSVLEFSKLLPFNVKRIFYTYDIGSTHVRGEHAHKQCHQFLISISGSLSVIIDNGKIREEFILDSPKIGLFLPAGNWGIQYKHSSECVLLVCASHEYDEKDYIRNYADFITYKEKII